MIEFAKPKVGTNELYKALAFEFYIDYLYSTGMPQCLCWNTAIVAVNPWLHKSNRTGGRPRTP